LLNLSLPDLAATIVIVVVSLTVHEFAHSLTAMILGDPTSRQEGRLSLNPLRHIDPVGFILLVVAGFGWAKPVRIDSSKLKKPRRDEILISLAGPASNALFAFLLALLLWLVIMTRLLPEQSSLEAVFRFITRAAMINVALAVFNLLPIPPLDGSHLVTPFLARINQAAAVTYFRYGSFALLALIVLDSITHLDILPIGRVTRAVVIGMYRMLGMAS
jgi:Zn-dependent protease